MSCSGIYIYIYEVNQDLPAFTHLLPISTHFSFKELIFSRIHFIFECIYMQERRIIFKWKKKKRALFIVIDPTNLNFKWFLRLNHQTRLFCYYYCCLLSFVSLYLYMEKICELKSAVYFIIYKCNNYKNRNIAWKHLLNTWKNHFIISRIRFKNDFHNKKVAINADF